MARLARLGVAKWWSCDRGGELDRWLHDTSNILCNRFVESHPYVSKWLRSASWNKFVENKWYDLRRYSQFLYNVDIHMTYIIYVIIGDVGEPEPHSRPLPQCGKCFELSEGRICCFLNQMLCYITICIYCLLFAPLSSLGTKLVIIVEQENGKHSPVLKSIFMQHLFCDQYESKFCSK